MADKTTNEITVDVKQMVKDLQGNIIADVMIKHIFTFQDNLIKTMVINN